jgi:nicotinamide mononucleotide transporter
MIEIIAVVFSLLSVYLTIKMKVVNWPIGIIGIIAYLILFCQQHLYGQAVLQLIFIIQSIYGWIVWKKYNERELCFIPMNTFLRHLMATIVLICVMTFVLGKYTDNPQPAFDSITTLFSLLATWYMAKKIIYNWLVWLMADIYFVLMFLEQKMYWSVGLYFILIFLVIKGLIEWGRNSTTA